MVRQVISIICAVIVLMLPLGSIALAADFTAYDGNLSSTYTTYFKDILSNVPITDNYVYFRSDQYTYDFVVGDLEYLDNAFYLVGDVGKHYSITTNGNYNSYHSYSVNELTEFTLTVDDKIVYSDLGDFPVLEQRSDKYEILTTITICVACLYVVINTIFKHSKGS